jgi:uncharacterized membrane protein required for colicin V production
MPLQTADYAVLAVLLIAGILGLFGGFSGALAFVCGLSAAGLAVRFGYGFCALWFETPWVAYLATVVLALVAFGLARLFVRKTVHGLLAQPGDALLGALVSAAAGGAAVLAVLSALDRFDLMRVDSALLTLLGGLSASA